MWVQTKEKSIHTLEQRLVDIRTPAWELLNSHEFYSRLDRLVVMIHAVSYCMGKKEKQLLEQEAIKLLTNLWEISRLARDDFFLEYEPSEPELISKFIMKKYHQELWPAIRMQVKAWCGKEI